MDVLTDILGSLRLTGGVVIDAERPAVLEHETARLRDDMRAAR